MKYFSIFAFLFLSITAVAQLNMEEVSYIPSPSGYYTNLIIKGNTNIKKLKTSTFNIQSYASFLDLNVTQPSILTISTITVSTGTAALSTIEGFSSISNWTVRPPISYNWSLPINIEMTGGNISLSQSIDSSSANIYIKQIEFQSLSNTPQLSVKTENIDFSDNNLDVDINELYIMGMKVPSCPNGYFWTPVYVNNELKSFQALACLEVSTTCNPQQEETCLHSGSDKCWNPTNCDCGDCT